MTSGRESVSGCNPNYGAQSFMACNPSYDDGGTTSWTAGYTAGTTTVTVASTAGFSVGGWIWLDMDATTSCVHADSAPGAGMFAHLAKITNISGSNITIDRGLRFDYNGSGCTGFDARPYYPVVNVGLEDLHITSDPGTPVCNDRSCIRFMNLGWEGVAESWVVGVKISRSYDQWMDVGFSARNWIQGNWFDDLDLSISFNTEGIWMLNASADIVIENNICTNARVCAENSHGAEGIIHAYNYWYQPVDPQNVRCEKAFFNHGRYPRENLLEGNDHNCEMMIVDAWWGRNGPRITAYRNRGTGTVCSHRLSNGNRFPWSFSADVDGSTGAPWASSYLNVIGNTYGEFVPTPISGSTCPPSVRGDPSSNTLSKVVDHIWVEKNAWRANPGNLTVGTSNNYSCGVSENDSCPGTNKNVSSPDASWNGSYPASLYRTSVPTWWCHEACPWGQDGIGAFGDDFGGALCKLPAQIRYEGGTCTAVSEPPPPPTPGLDPPFLFDN
jgi:hypothetical protein